MHSNTKNRPIVAFIDDGVNLPGVSPAFDVEAVGGHIVPRVGHVPADSHGSLCAKVFLQFAPGAAVGSVKVLDAGCGNGDCKNLVAAIEWCARQGICLVNMSVGSCSAADYAPLYQAAAQAEKAGTVIVCACKNGRNTSYPAGFASVVGVMHDSSLAGDAYHPRPYPNGGVEFAACGVHSMLPTKGGNSLAAPVITAHIYRLACAGNFVADPAAVKKALSEAVGKSLPAPPPDPLALYPPDLEACDSLPLVLLYGPQAAKTAQALITGLRSNGYTPLAFSEHPAPDMVAVSDANRQLGHCFGMAAWWHADLLLYLPAAAKSYSHCQTADVTLHCGQPIQQTGWPSEVHAGATPPTACGILLGIIGPG